MHILLVILMILFFADSALAQMCSTNAGNAAGDIVEAWINFWNTGKSAITYNMTINGVEWRNYGGAIPLYSGNGSPCGSQCSPIRFTARTGDVIISTNVVSGNGSGWNCTQVSQVVGHEEGPVPNKKKEQAARNQETFTNLSFFFQGAMIGPCRIILEPYTCAGSTTGALISGLFAASFKRIREKDPWDENYLSIYDPPWPDIGVPWTDDWYTNQMIGATQGAVQMTDFVMVEIDRYTSCGMAGVDCVALGVNHRAYIEWGIWMLGWYLNEAGSNAWTVAYIMEQNGAESDLVNAMRYFAQTSNDAGWEFQQ